MRVLLAAVAALFAVTTPVLAMGPPSWPAGVDLSHGVDLDEDYRLQFELCDTAEHFRGVDFSQRRSCESDPNKVTVLRRLEGGPIAYVSKLSIDFDGSPLACGPDRDRSDQCPTSLMLPNADGVIVPVNADSTPYVVIPNGGGPAENHGEFHKLTGLGVGDFGVVLWRDRIVPVIVADTGPFNKLGEGSLALHRALGHEQCAERDGVDTCVRAKDQISINSDVVTILFPGTAIQGLTAETLNATVKREGLRLWAAYSATHPIRRRACPTGDKLKACRP